MGQSEYARSIGHGAALDEVVRSVSLSEEAALRRLRTARESLWRARTGTGRPAVFFLHMLKTGGTALINGLRRLVPEDLCLTGLYLDHLVGVPRYALESAALIAGHLPYETIDLLPQQTALCTVLRHPLDRILSHYSHLSRDPNVRRGEPDFSLERFLSAPHWRNHSNNHQARQLVHRIEIVNAWTDFSPRERLEELGCPLPADAPHPLDALFSCSSLDMSDDDLRQKAIENLGSIDLVGVTDRLDSLFVRAAAVLGVTGTPPLLKENVGSNRIQRADVPSSLIDTILERNAIDLALYELAVTRQNEPAVVE